LKIKITESVIRDMIAGKIKDDVFDTRLTGFVARPQTERVGWTVVFQWYGKPKWFTFSNSQLQSLGEARVEAQKLLLKVEYGEDPRVEREKAKLESSATFVSLLPTYLKRKRDEGLREGTLRQTRSILGGNCEPLYNLPVRTIDRTAIASLLAKVERGDVTGRGGPSARNNTRKELNGFFDWVAKEGYCDSNPVIFTNRAPTKPRTRLLSDDEVRLILVALDAISDEDFCDVMLLLFLTGLRRKETAGLEWSEVNLDTATLWIPPERMKNKKLHGVPLSAPALAILQKHHDRLEHANPRKCVFGPNGNGFGSWYRWVTRLRAKVIELSGGPIPQWTRHDSRRYVSTTLNERLGVEPHVVEAVLSHYPKGVAGRYNKSQYINDKRAALDKLALHLEAVKTGQTQEEAKIIRFDKRA
jgi:integrase